MSEYAVSMSLLSDGSQFTSMLIHPRIDGGIAFDSTVESQQFRSHRRSVFALCYVAPLNDHAPAYPATAAD
jgi:hypothetical protein